MRLHAKRYLGTYNDDSKTRQQNKADLTVTVRELLLTIAAGWTHQSAKKQDKKTMKNNMRTLITGLFALTLMFGFSLNANAQAGQTDTDDVRVSASVVVDIDVQKITDLAFGNVRQGQVTTANPVNGAFANIVGGTQTIGKFQVIGAAGANVTVSWPATLALATENGVAGDGDAINFVPSISFQAGNGSGNNGGDLVEDGNVSRTYDINGDVGTGVDRDTFWVGGALYAKGSTEDPIQPAAFGAYANDLTITAAYN